MKFNDVDIRKINHSCFRIEAKGKVVYFDPFKVENEEEADLVFISHEHFDHCSREDLEKVCSEKTLIVLNNNSVSKVTGVDVGEIVTMQPGKNVKIGDFKVHAVPAYNTNKFKAPGQPFHPKEDEHCGYIVDFDGTKIYHMGDTDNIPELKGIECNVVLIPVSGKYVMTAEEAAEAVKIMNFKTAIPMHYGTIVGSKEDAEKFKELANCEVSILD